MTTEKDHTWTMSTPASVECIVGHGLTISRRMYLFELVGDDPERMSRAEVEVAASKRSESPSWRVRLAAFVLSPFGAPYGTGWTIG